MRRPCRLRRPLAEIVGITGAATSHRAFVQAAIRSATARRGPIGTSWLHQPALVRRRLGPASIIACIHLRLHNPHTDLPPLNMITDKVKELEALKQKAAALEQQVAAERARELAALPKEFGFDDPEAFIDAVIAATGGRRGRRGRPADARHPRGRGTRHPRTKITDEIRQQVKKMTGAGKTGAEIAAAVDISLPSVQNIKKSLGLVKRRK